MAETIFQKPLDAQVASNTEAIASLGTVLTGAWTATSSAATLVQLSQAVNLTKGTWLLIVTVPYASSGTPVITIGPENTVDNNQQFGTAVGSGTQCFRIMNVSTPISLYAMSGGSAAVSYDQTLLQRGGIKAMKIGM